MSKGGLAQLKKYPDPTAMNQTIIVVFCSFISV